MSCVHLGDKIVVCRPGPWQPATRFRIEVPVGEPGRFVWFQRRRRHQMWASCCRTKRWACYLEIAPDPWYDDWPTRCKKGRGCNRPGAKRRRRRAA